ncbi:MAG: leucine-rich repeat protein, partial [Clostridia bacterium]|nr:leucine-rich repeat protein [Clostridia bacterium]
MKRVISAFLSVIMLLSLIPFAALAQETVILNEAKDPLDDVILTEQSEAKDPTPDSAETAVGAMLASPAARDSVSNTEESAETYENEKAAPLPPIAENMETYSGSCGTGLSWLLDTSTGVLSITGSGAMTNYSYHFTNGSTAPWASSRSYIKTVVIGNSVMFIDAFAFYDCPNLMSITVADENTVYHSAGNCLIETTSKTLISGCNSSVIPDDGSVTTIGEYAFSGCAGLMSVTIPDSI